MLLSNETLGKRIAHYRKERQLTQAKLAAIVGMEHNHLSCIEAGLKYPRINLIARLAVGLGVSIDELGEYAKVLAIVVGALIFCETGFPLLRKKVMR